MELGASLGHILVVDDNTINRMVLSRALKEQGYTASMASNGRQALTRLHDPHDTPVDVVLLDILMPEMDGYSVLAQIMADAELRHVPVIMISAVDDMDSVIRCIEMGATDYLPKPFNAALLRARIGASVEKKRLRDREVLYLQQIDAERRRADELLHVILPAEIVSELKATNTVVPRRYDDVAVLFCDIAGFTAFCDAHQPEEVVPYLQQLVEAFEEIALRHDMQKIKTIGDAFMAASGLLKPVANPVLNSIHCGLEMLAATEALPIDWAVRVGIHVGPVVAGVVGQRQYLFDLWGDTVNTAARMESHGIPGCVTLSSAAWHKVAHACEGDSLGMVAVKGKGHTEMIRFRSLKAEARVR